MKVAGWLSLAVGGMMLAVLDPALGAAVALVVFGMVLLGEPS